MLTLRRNWVAESPKTVLFMNPGNWEDGREQMPLWPCGELGITFWS